VPPPPQEEEEDDGEEELCNCEFSLGYGGRILLNNARLRLKRGRRYGLCGVSHAWFVCVGVCLGAAAGGGGDGSLVGLAGSQRLVSLQPMAASGLAQLHAEPLRCAPPLTQANGAGKSTLMRAIRWAAGLLPCCSPWARQRRR
jgi:hypothetical protein